MQKVRARAYRETQAVPNEGKALHVCPPNTHMQGSLFSNRTKAAPVLFRTKAQSFQVHCNRQQDREG